MDQDQPPIGDALGDTHRQNRYGFTPPGHRQGRGVDKRMIEVPGADPSRPDLAASGGMDDRKSSHSYVETAQEVA